MSEIKLARRLWSAQNGFVDPEDGLSISAEEFHCNYEIAGALHPPRGMPEPQISRQATALGAVFYADSGFERGIIAYKRREHPTTMAQLEGDLIPSSGI